MKNRGDNHRLLSRIAAAGRSGWSPRSSSTGYAACPKPVAKPQRPGVTPDHGPGYRKSDGIRSWRAD